MMSVKIHLILVSFAVAQAVFSNEDSHSVEDWSLSDLVGSSASQYLPPNHRATPLDDPIFPYASSNSDISTKLIPREDKSFKKPTHPFREKPGVDFKPGSPYCTQFKKHQTGDGFMTCYKCKDPDSGISYERCSNSGRIVNTRTRRSHPRKDDAKSREEEVEGEDGEDSKDFSLPEEYRFSEEYFLPQATKPASYKDKSDQCERVVEGSMVCMVCRNARTNGKYKQCSYVHDPREKAYEYTKSSLFSGETSKEAPGGRDKEAISEESGEDASWDKKSQEYNDGKVAESGGCKKVQKADQVCTVCKDPKTGGNSEKCYYEFQPSDKVYKYSRSKTFGFPYPSSFDKQHSAEESVESEESQNQKSTKQLASPSAYKGFGYSPFDDHEQYKSSESKSEYDFNPVSSIYDSESEKIAAESKSADCHEVRKDSMVCSVCKDPKTGGNSERCTYSYQPKDKMFSYSKKKTYGNPTEIGDQGEKTKERSGAESSESGGDGFKFAESQAKDAKAQGNRTGFSEEWDPKVSSSSPATNPSDSSKFELGYLDTSKRKAEIEKFLEDFRAGDRSKCEKVMRDKMTCYRCVDDRGFQNEECMYVTEPGFDSSNKKVKREPAREESPPLEPMAAASSPSGTFVRVRRAQRDKQDDKPEAQSTREVEPYDSASETRYRYDEVLGFSLPEYMLNVSEQEAEFDKIVAAGY